MTVSKWFLTLACGVVLGLAFACSGDPGSTDSNDNSSSMLDGSAPDSDIGDAEPDGAPPAPVVDPFFAVSMGNTAGASDEAALQYAFERLAELGVTYTKWNFNWRIIEPSQGQYDWQPTDAIASLAEQHGISVIVFCNQASLPLWATNVGTMYAPRDPQEYADFVHAVVQRYRDPMAIEYVELLNEISNGVTDGTAPSPLWDDTVSYAVDVGNTVYDTLHDSFPEIRVGPASFTQPHGISDGLAAECAVKDAYMQNYFAAAPRMDFLALHNYPHYGPTQMGTCPYASQHGFVTNYRELLDDAGLGDTPIIITEGAIGLGGGIDDGTYAAFLAQDLTVQLAQHEETNLLVMVKGTLANVVSGPGGWNIIDPILEQPLPAFTALKTTASLLSRHPLFQSIEAGTPDDDQAWVLRFASSSGKLLFVAFAPIGIEYPDPDQPVGRYSYALSPQAVVIQTGLTNVTVTVTTIDGQSSTQQTDTAGQLSLDVSIEPVFLELDGA